MTSRFRVSDGEYSLQTFQKWIIENSEKLFPSSAKRKWLKIHAIRTVQNEWQKILEPFCVKSLGDIWHVRLPTHVKSNRDLVDFYIGEYSPKLLLFFTISTNTEYEKAIGVLVRHLSGLGRMWIGPKLFDDLILHFAQNFKPTVQRFLGFYSTRDRFQPRIRPTYDRSIQWSAKDGFETIAELRELYGIRPKSVFMRLKKGNLQFTNEGLFVITRINQEMFDALEEALSFIKTVEEYLTGVTQSMKLDFENVPLAKKEITIPQLTSGSIHLKKTLLNKSIAERFMQSSEKFDYINVEAIDGSFSWVATAIDKDKRSAFGVSSNESTIKLIPRASSTFESFLEFYRQVLEELDELAVLESSDRPDGES